MEVCNIFNIDFARLNSHEAAELCAAAVEKGGDKHRLPFFVATTNALMCEKSRRSQKFTSLLNSADLNVADGIGIILASKLLGTPLPERIAGIDLAERILSFCEEKGYRIFLLGGRAGIAEAAKKRLTERFRGLKICGTHHGYFEKRGEENRKVLEIINASAPDVLFVCFGFPLQECWIYENRAQLSGLGLCMGLGGSLDVWSGNTRRAPKFIRDINLEWLWRILSSHDRLSAIPPLCSFSLSVLLEAPLTRIVQHARKKAPSPHGDALNGASAKRRLPVQANDCA